MSSMNIPQNLYFQEDIGVDASLDWQGVESIQMILPKLDSPNKLQEEASTPQLNEWRRNH